MRRSKEEDFLIQEELQSVKEKVRSALENAGFTSIRENNTINQTSADYHKMTLWGNIDITMIPDGNVTRVHLKSTAKVDNIYALFSSPNDRILRKFKNQL